MAITTLYRDIEYRSRLEARWAAFFDRISWEHTYEPFDGDGYIPDFLIHGEAPLLVEVKPAVTETDYRAPIEKVSTGLARHWQRDILIVGTNPVSGLPSAWREHPSAGLLGEWGEIGDWYFQPANWSLCTDCPTAHIGVWHDTGYYAIRPCMGGRGDQAWNTGRHIIAEAWADACNRVKWYGKPVVA